MITLKYQKVKYTTFVIIILFLLCACHNSDNSSSVATDANQSQLINENLFTVEYQDGMFVYNIFDINGNIIESGTTWREPNVITYSDDVISVVWQMGTGPSTRQGFFCDAKTGIRSNDFSYVLSYSKGLIAYGDSESNVIIESVFTENYHKIISYSMLQNPANDVPDIIIDAKFSEDNKTLIVTYVSSEHKLVSQEFEI